jgi:hypothetical protein
MFGVNGMVTTGGGDTGQSGVNTAYLLKILLQVLKVRL